jgi:DNA-binding XRE family transcriptional regulator
MGKLTDRVPEEVRERARRTREALKGRPPIEELLTPEELAEASPFYLTLRAFVADVRAVRQERGLTLAQVAATTGLAVETLSRLETGALVNPTWQTLGKYAAAVGCHIRLQAERIEPGR